MTIRPWVSIPAARRYVLADVRTPAALTEVGSSGADVDGEGSVALDLVIDGGRLAETHPAGQAPVNLPRVELAGRQVWPALVDMHAHLDKGHVVSRNPPDGTVATALARSAQDWKHWTPEDMTLRMEFGLRCAWAHGVSAIRTHLDCVTLDQARRGFEVFSELRCAWAGRIALQGVSGTPFAAFLEPHGKQIADLVADHDGVLGGVPDGLRRSPHGRFEGLEAALDAMFRLAAERGLDVDLHVDPTDDPTAFTLTLIARAKIRTGFAGRVVCGHCANLSLQADDVIETTLAEAKEADLAFAVMPTPMLYLMDRRLGRTPRWRGITVAKEILAAGLPLAVAGDNCRDTWYAFGDHDMLDTLKQAIRVCQLGHAPVNEIGSIG